MLAVINGNFELVKYLIEEKKSNVACKGNYFNLFICKIY